MFEAFVSRTRTTTKCFEICFPFFSIPALSSPQELVLFLCFFFTCWIRILRVNPDLAEAGSETMLRSNFDSKRHLILLIPRLAPDLNICIHLFGIHLAIRFYVSLEPEVCL